MKRGELWWANADKRRPVLLVSREEAYEQPNARVGGAGLLHDSWIRGGSPPGQTGGVAEDLRCQLRRSGSHSQVRP